MYQSQHRITDLVTGAKALARYRGTISANIFGLKAAEAFLALSSNELKFFWKFFGD